jgi:hypothetical protein
MRLLFGLWLLGACSTKTPTCTHGPGETCACQPTDTIRDCIDPHGAPGLEYCENGTWSDCSPFLDGGTD